LDYIGFQETKKQQFSDIYLKCVLGNKNFAWKHLPSVGSAGGILVGINLDLFDVLAWEIKNFSVTVVARNKILGLVVRITIVYGSPYEEKKDEFISELHELFQHWKGLLLLVVTLTWLDLN
jgi:hypothetical protein